MLYHDTFIMNPLEENTYIVWDETDECVIVDPGCYTKAERKSITDFIKNKQLIVKYILNTHCHIDHVLGNKFLKETYKVPVGIHDLERPVLKAVAVYASSYGIFNYEEVEEDFYFRVGESIKFGNSALEVLFVPGHSPGHVAFLSREQNLCFSGDVLFLNSIGRTDLPGGDYFTLFNSIKNQLLTLSDELKILPGHGPSTTIRYERKTNPYLQKLL